MRCGGYAQQLLPFSHSGVVNSLDVDVVARHHDVTDLGVLFCICHLRNGHVRYKKLDLELSLSSGMSSFLTRTGIMWLWQEVTGRPESISICRSSFTFRWCFRRSARPSSPFSTPMDSLAPANSMGGKDVVKMKPVA